MAHPRRAGVGPLAYQRDSLHRRGGVDCRPAGGETGGATSSWPIRCWPGFWTTRCATGCWHESGPRVKLPKAKPRRNVYLTAEQLERLADESGRYRSLVLLLGVGGLRWGETAASRVRRRRRRVELHPQCRRSRRPGLKSARSNPTRTAPWCCPLRDGSRSRRLRQARNATNCCGPRRPVASSRRRPRRSRGFPAPCCVARRSIKDFPWVTAHALAAYRSLVGHLCGCESEGGSADLGHASAAMTLDVYADLFDSDLDTVAEVWPNVPGHGAANRSRKERLYTVLNSTYAPRRRQRPLIHVTALLAVQVVQRHPIDQVAHHRPVDARIAVEDRVRWVPS